MNARRKKHNSKTISFVGPTWGTVDVCLLNIYAIKYLSLINGHASKILPNKVS